jgi:hypothetical protein
VIRVLATIARYLHAERLSIPGLMCCVQAQSVARRIGCNHKPKNVQKSASNRNYWYRSMRGSLANKQRFEPNAAQQEVVHYAD